MKFSRRLQALFDMIPKCQTLVDIGTDHGILVIKAVQNGKCQHAYGLDIASGPLRHAQCNVGLANLQHSITLMKLDGLKGFKEKADVFVIAGMGAETIWDIIDNYTFNESHTILIQSNSKNPWLRETLTRNGFMIVDETFLIDKNKTVFIMKIQVGNQTLSEEEIFIGPVLMKNNSKEYLDYLTEYRIKLRELKKINHEFDEEFMLIDTYLKERSV